MFSTHQSLLQKIDLSHFNKLDVELFIKRDDLIDPYVSGNKWRKLKYIISTVIQAKKEGVLTFGGAYSNHLLATAIAGQKAGLKTIGIVRGEELTAQSNELLQKCEAAEMQLEFITREEYALRNEKFYKDELAGLYSNFHLVPEGGAAYLGMIGCQEILAETPNDFDYVFVAQGTTTTSCGIAMALPEKTTLCVVPVLKGFDSKAEMSKLFGYSGFSKETIDELLEKTLVLCDYHFGAYGKYTPELLQFMEEIFQETSVPLDPIYTGKAFYAMVNWVLTTGVTNKKILFVHTGGIEGGRAIAEKEKRLFF
jgi:1-aminocyclopropane-1-carboxylate deaminase